MRRFLHQSYFFVALCGGVVTGIVLTGFFGSLPIFRSPYWLILAVLIFAYTYFYPSRALLAAAFGAGLIIGFVRGGELSTELGLNEAAMMRDWFAERIQNSLPTAEASLGMAYLMGVKDNLSKSFTESLRVAGLTHVVVASGTHLSILIGAARRAFGKISRRAGLIFALVLIFGFAAIVGFSPSILRAGLVSALSLMAWYTGRKFAPWRIILLAATITLLVDPAFLTNLGWQLSFASYAGIMIISPLLTRYFYGSKKPGFLAQTLLATLSATLMTAPISLYHFGSLSIIAFAANLIILPTLPYVMGATFAAGVLAGIPIINTVAEFCLKFHISIINFFGEQRMFLIEIPAKDLKILLLYIPILIFLLWIRQKQIKMVKLDKINWRKHVRTQ